jgi:antitoxin HicB
LLRYLIKLEPDDKDTLLVTCPALPEVTTFGDDEADALRHARNAIEAALAARIADGLDIPAPATRRRGRAVALPLMTALKVPLYRSLREAGLTRAELMRRLG